MFDLNDATHTAKMAFTVASYNYAQADLPLFSVPPGLATMTI